MALNDKITIDIARRGTIHVPAKQADHGYGIVIEIVRNGENIVDADHDTASFREGKPDGTGYFGDATVNPDGTVTVPIDDDGQMLAVPGYAVVDVTLSDQYGAVKSTQNFVLDIQPAPGGEAIESYTVFTELQDLVRAVEGFDADAEAFAAGTRDGVPVDPDDPAYENNAKYYNELAEDAAREAVETLENKANVDGYYEDLTAGMAEQLVSTVGVTDSVPYNRRTTGGSADVGDRLAERAIVGGSVAWNQLAEKGKGSANSSTKSYDSTTGITTITPTNYGSDAAGVYGLTDAVYSVVGHKYLCSVEVNPDYSLDFKYGFTPVQVSPVVSANTWTQLTAIINYASASFIVYGRLATNNWSTGTFKIRNVQCTDLTALFGTTIADYIYSLETANTGSGVAWLKNHGYFTKPYYPYTPAPSMESVMVGEHRTVGLNQFDPDTGKASLIGGMQYQITGAYTALSIDGVSVTPDSNGKFTPTADGELTVTGGNASTTCVHLVWDSSRDGEYEPYTERTYALDSSVVLRGIPKLDAYNNLYYDGDRYLPDGTVERKFKQLTFTDSTSWSYYQTGGKNTFNVQISNAIPNVAGLLSAFYAYMEPSGHYISNQEDKTFFIYSQSATNIRLSIRDDAYSDAASFKAHMEGVQGIFEITPFTETAEPWQEVQIIDDFGTEEYTDAAYENGDRDFALPVGHESYYQLDLRSKLEMVPNSPSGDGDWVVRQSGGINEYVPLSIPQELPNNPSTDGAYALKCTVSGGTATLTWEPV